MNTTSARWWKGILLFCGVVVLAVGLTGCVSGKTSTHPHPKFIVGADISSVPASQARGIAFSENGKPEDILQILKRHGFNYIRLRIFVEPTNSGGYSAEGYCDLTHTIAMAKRVKAAGMGLLLDFHYSDTWADPGKQTKPLAWRKLAQPQLTQAVHDYTKNVILRLRDAGAEPDMAQVGNEITPGFLLNTLPARRGDTPKIISDRPEGSTREWNVLASFLKAGIAGVREVDPKIQIMLHLDRGGDNAKSRWWVDNALAQGVRFDILGESCYTRWQGPVAKWKENFDDLATRYPGLKYMIVEAGADVGAANEIMRGMPGHRGLGTFIWEPTRGSNQQQLFDTNGAVIPEKMKVYDELMKELDI